MYVVNFLLDHIVKLYNTLDEAEAAALDYLDEYGYGIEALNLFYDSLEDLTFEGFAVDDVLACVYGELPEDAE